MKSVGATAPGQQRASRPRHRVIVGALGVVGALAGLSVLVVPSGWGHLARAVRDTRPTRTLPPAQTQAFSVPPGDTVTFTLQALTARTTVEGRFVVQGGRGRDIGFAIVDSRSNLILKEDRVVCSREFRFQVATPGSHFLLWNNTASFLKSKDVVLTFRVR